MEAAGEKKYSRSKMCRYCLKKMYKRHLQKHESKCAAANLSLPEGYRVEKQQKHLMYVCPCGYTNRRSRIFNHIARYHSGAIKVDPYDESPRMHVDPDDDPVEPDKPDEPDEPDKPVEPDKHDESGEYKPDHPDEPVIKVEDDNVEEPSVPRSFHVNPAIL